MRWVRRTSTRAKRPVDPEHRAIARLEAAADSGQRGEEQGLSARKVTARDVTAIQAVSKGRSGTLPSWSIRSRPVDSPLQDLPVASRRWSARGFDRRQSSCKPPPPNPDRSKSF